jgi:hypothetical protein
MSDIEKLFIAAYPLWPKQLLEKFSNLLSFEVARFNPDINTEIVNLYNSLAAPVVSTQPQNGSISIFNPFGGNASRSDFTFFPVAYYHIDEHGNYSDTYTVPCSYAIYFDRRLFSGVSASASVRNVRTGQMGFTRNPNYIRPSGQLSWGVGNEFMEIHFLRPEIVVSVSPVLLGYSGASTVLAMVQNGESVEIDKALLSEFVTFLNGYSKYSGQLAADKSLQETKISQDLEQYKNNISDKLTARKNDLNDLKTQIMFAAKNETSSAKRDMQNLSLSAQSLMLQLQSKIS